MPPVDDAPPPPPPPPVAELPAENPAAIRRAVWLPKITFAVMILGVFIAAGIADQTKSVNRASVRNEAMLKRVESTLDRIERDVEAVNGMVRDIHAIYARARSDGGAP